MLVTGTRIPFTFNKESVGDKVVASFPLGVGLALGRGQHG